MIDAYRQKWTFGGGGWALTAHLDTAAVTQNVKAPKVSTLALRVQWLKVLVITGSGGKTWTFAGSTGAPVLTNALDMSTAGVVHEFDYGPEGVLLGANESLRVTISAAGAAAIVTAEGYAE